MSSSPRAPAHDTDALDAVLAAVTAVADGNEESLLLRSCAGRRRWVQITRVVGEDSLLCETVSDEYLDRFHQLPSGAGIRLSTLSWHGGSGTNYTRWSDAGTPEERRQLADLLLRTLVEALGHDPRRVPTVSRP